ncbi:hypothetical protein D9619_006640 [Psilocybe cf. subviscida]|uniref:Inhibitor I9 domain-containing protein n=1 Tax=Psilocybe cf. subviscida TaxID=2480587 RepID=A0A8H5B3V4_9AGAR|nr:hypothetical protein D9619_006640 [Psilocybe cf. subviscida]
MSETSYASATTDKYIVVFKKEVNSDEITKYVDEIKENKGIIGQRFDQDGDIIHGFSAVIPEAFFNSPSFKSLQANKIDYIEPDSVVTTQ